MNFIHLLCRLLGRLLLCLALLPAGAALAQGKAAPAAADPALEARVMLIAEELRCLVCQNETIAASHAELAVDLRQQIRQQLEQGRTPPQILEFMAERYGDFVLYRPPLKAQTLLLWLGPFALLLLAGWALWRQLRTAKPGDAASPSHLSAAEFERAQRLLQSPGERP